MVNVGYIGVGNMGRPIAQRILNAGYSLTISDLRKEAAQPLLEKGARWAETAKAVAQNCDVVFTCLPGPPEVEEVVYGENGLMAGWKKGDIYVDMTTNSPHTIRKIAKDARAKEVEVLDVPVSGGVAGAEAGTLTIMVGGDAQTLGKVRKVLEAVSFKVFHLGELGCGHITKLVNNMIFISCNAATAEAFVLGVKAGIDPKKLWDVITVSSGNTPYVQRYPSSVFKGLFDVSSRGFRLALACKDVSLAPQVGREFGVAVPIADAAAQLYREAREAGLGDKISWGIILQLEKKAGVQVRTKE